MTLPSLQPGTLFGSRWIVGRVLGKGELAVVHEAEEARAARFAALKLLDSALARDAAAWTRFETLTRAIAEIPGEGVARSYDIGLNDGRPFIVSERCRFPTLSRYVAERGALATRAFNPALATLAGALDAAHAAGITHGNLKPQNVFVSIDNAAWARLTDFGLAELREAAGVNPPRTLGWSAPEVSPSPPTPASDLFALGLLSFFALSGIPWYSAQRSKTVSGSDPPRSASERARAFGGELPRALDAWFERALARNPSDRFANAIEMAHAFTSAVDGHPGSAPSIRVEKRDGGVGPLSATVPVPERSPFAGRFPSQHPPQSKAPDPNAPTAPQFQVTEPVPARQAPAFPSTSPPPLAATNVSTLPAPNLSTPPRSTSIVVPPPSVIAIALGALALAALIAGALVWLIFGPPP